MFVIIHRLCVIFSNYLKNRHCRFYPFLISDLHVAVQMLSLFFDGGYFEGSSDNSIMMRICSILCSSSSVSFRQYADKPFRSYLSRFCAFQSLSMFLTRMLGSTKREKASSTVSVSSTPLEFGATEIRFQAYKKQRSRSTTCKNVHE